MSKAIKVVLVICALNVFMTAGLLIYGHTHQKVSAEGNKIITELQADDENYYVDYTKKNLEVAPAGWEDMAKEEGAAHAGTIGVILYPEDSIGYSAYGGIAREIADQGALCVVPKPALSMPGFSSKEAKKIMKNHPEVRMWIIGGHGGGGKKAIAYEKKHQKDFVGVFFLSSYIEKDYSKVKTPGVVMYGDKDGVMDMDKYMDTCLNYPKHTDEVVIKGGNFQQFANCDAIKGDGKATISAEKQQEKAAEEILKLAN